MTRRPPAVPDPFALWADFTASALSLGASAARFGEMMIASALVVSRRWPMVEQAWRDPLIADRRELARMVTEKADAWRQAQADAAEHLSALASDLAEAGGVQPWSGRAGRGPMDSLASAAAAIEKALDPWHRRATANARRLGARKAQSRRLS